MRNINTKKKVLLLSLLALLAAGAVLLAVFYPRLVPQLRPMPDLPRVEAPPGSQLLLYPVDHGLMIAGYRNPNYLEKHGYPHYGIDITNAGSGRIDILASGQGMVLGTEFCDNSLGHIAVIRYDNVYLPRTGETVSLIARSYHMIELYVEAGDRVEAGQVMGVIDRGHKWYNHIHLELDADLDYPFHTPQVAEATSRLLHRYPANGEQMQDPIWILVVGQGQRVYENAGSSLCADKDVPQYAVPE